MGLPLRPAALVLAAVVAGVLAGAAGSARAHGGGALDLEDLESYVAAQAETATGRAWFAYRALDRVLDRPIRRPLVDEIPKLRAVEVQCRTRLATDTELKALLDAAVLRAAAALDEEPEEVETIARGIERPSVRARVLAAGARAERVRERGDAAPGLAGRLHLWERAARAFAAADRLGQRLVVRQARRRAPGQPIAKGAAGTIATYAGSGFEGFAGDGLPARAASFSLPCDAAIDPTTGLLHVADTNNHRIRRLDADGRVRTAIGGGRLGDTTGPALEALLHHPTAVAFDPRSGALFVAGWHSARIPRLDPATGLVAYAAGSGETGFDGDGEDATLAVLAYPSNVAFAADGAWFVADQGNRRVRRVAGTSNVIETIAGDGNSAFGGDDGPALLASFDLPADDSSGPAGKVCLSPDERFLYVADTGNRRVRRIDLNAPGLTITTIAGTGEEGTGGDDGPAADATFTAPVDVDCDAAGNVYVCDRDAHVVRRIDVASGKITAFAGSGVEGAVGDGGPATAARLDRPQGICVDRLRGRLYIADSSNHVIRVVWE